MDKEEEEILELISEEDGLVISSIGPDYKTKAQDVFIEDGLELDDLEHRLFFLT